MRCRDARQRWHNRLDQSGLDTELDRHLAGCGSCRTYAARMEQLVGLLNDLREDTELLASPGSDAGLHAAPRLRRGWITPSARRVLRIAAAVLLTVTVGLWYGMERKAPVVDRNLINTIPAMGITLRAQSRERFIAVAAPSAEPNVQTYWLYPLVTVTDSRDRS